MSRLLAALPRSFARFADGATGVRHRSSRTIGATLERRRVAAALAVAGRPGAAASAVREGEGSPDLASGGETLRGPGWFESSWELRSGLEVREGLPGDLGANEWLEAFCASRPATVAAA